MGVGTRDQRATLSLIVKTFDSREIRNEKVILRKILPRIIRLISSEFRKIPHTCNTPIYTNTDTFYVSFIWSLIAYLLVTLLIRNQRSYNQRKGLILQHIWSFVLAQQTAGGRIGLNQGIKCLAYFEEMGSCRCHFGC